MPWQVNLNSLQVASPAWTLSELLPCANAVWMPYNFEFGVAGEVVVTPINNLLRVEGRSNATGGTVEVSIGGRVSRVSIPGSAAACDIARHLAREIVHLFSVKCISHCLKELDGDIDGLVLVDADPDWEVSGHVDDLIFSRTDLDYSGPYYKKIELGALGLNFGELGLSKAIDVFVLGVDVEGGFDAMTGIPGEFAVAGMTDRVFLPARAAANYKILLAHELAHALTQLEHGVGGLLNYPASPRLYDDHAELILERKSALLTSVPQLGARPDCPGIESVAAPSFRSALLRLRSLDSGALIESVASSEGGLKYYALRLLVAKEEYQLVADRTFTGMDRSRLGLFALYAEDAPNFREVFEQVRNERESSPDQVVGLRTLQRVLSLQNRWEAEGQLRILFDELRRAYDPRLAGFAPWDPLFGGHPSAVWAARVLRKIFPGNALAKWSEELRLGFLSASVPFVQELPGRLLTDE